MIINISLLLILWGHGSTIFHPLTGICTRLQKKWYEFYFILRWIPLSPLVIRQASEIVKAVERNPSVGFSLVTHLQGAHGNQQFDRITRTKTVETILASTDIEGMKKYTASLVSQLRQVETSK
jgi:hypothetical protein